MKLKSVSLTVLAAAAAVVVSACGGGGGGAAAPQASLQLSGVAATGLALANSTVDVKCVSGTGTATTNDSGSYTVTVENGEMPCLVKVTGKAADGTDVTLHSVAEGGTTSGGTTSATVNVTPLTEMILARAAGTLPVDLFANFGSGVAAAVTGNALIQAKTDVLTILRDAVGVDLGSIDPFTTSLVAATASNLSGGNDYDKALDALGTKVSAAVLPQVISQIASTAASGSSAPASLTEVMANVSAGSLAGCPAALSGKYRLVEYTGAIDTVDINFGTMKLTAGTEVVDLVANSSQPCQFTAKGASVTEVVIGPTGAGAFADAERVGYIFPAQAHSFASVQGKWEFLESGVVESNLGEHFVGELDVGADGKATVCDYAVMSNNFDTCTLDTDEAVSMTAGSDGGFVLNYGADVSRVYGFRAPSGSLTLFGSANPDHVTSDGAFRTHFVMTRPQLASLSEVGSVTKVWNLVQRYFPSSDPTKTGPLSTDPLKTDTITVTAVDASAGSATRSHGDSSVDTVVINEPIDGLRFRAQTSTSAPIYMRTLPGLGITASIDALPPKRADGITNNPHLYILSVNRP